MIFFLNVCSTSGSSNSSHFVLYWSFKAIIIWSTNWFVATSRTEISFFIDFFLMMKFESKEVEMNLYNLLYKVEKTLHLLPFLLSMTALETKKKKAEKTKTVNSFIVLNAQFTTCCKLLLRWKDSFYRFVYMFRIESFIRRICF